jgi:hypothetical protein
MNLLVESVSRIAGVHRETPVPPSLAAVCPGACLWAPAMGLPSKRINIFESYSARELCA